MKPPHSCTMLIMLAGAALLLFVHPATTSSSLLERTFHLTCTAEVHDIPLGAKQVEIWLPYPPSADYQGILKGKVTTPYPTKILTDPEYGNKIVLIEVKNPEAATIPITMELTVLRSSA